MINKTRKTLAIILLSSISMLATACLDGDDNAPSQVKIGLKMGGYTTASWYDFILPKAHANVSDLKLCFKRLRFKLADEETVDPNVDEDNIDFNLGEVALGVAGADLGEVIIPAKVYKRIEFDLESDCASGSSIDLTNDNGTFNSADRITIKFSGTFNANADGVLTLGVQSILDQLNAYNGVGTLKDAAEAISGEL